nr:unnamed protein product [Spirometra erinaceieuropaei]
MLCDKYPALPVYALVDADPHGIGIYLNYKYGSQNEAMKLSETTSPFLQRFRLLGILPSELSRLQIPSEGLLDLTDTDRTLIKTMKERAYMDSEPEVTHKHIGEGWPEWTTHCDSVNLSVKFPIRQKLNIFGAKYQQIA